VAAVSTAAVSTLAVLLGGCLHDLLDEGAGATTQDREQEHRRQDRKATGLEPGGAVVVCTDGFRQAWVYQRQVDQVAEEAARCVPQAGDAVGEGHAHRAQGDPARFG